MEEFLKKIGLNAIDVFWTFASTVLHLIISGKVEKQNLWRYVIAVPLSAIVSAKIGPLAMNALNHPQSGTLCAVLLGFILLDFSKNPRQFIKSVIDLKNRWTPKH